MPITNNNSNPTVVVTEQVNKIVVNAPGPQGPRGKTILNGNGVPADNLGFEGDFYYDKLTTRFYGPKPLDASWSGATSYLLSTSTLTYPFSINRAGDILETGIDYNSINKITLTMAQPFGGTAYLS